MNPDKLEAQIREALHEQYDVQRELPGGGMSRVFLAAERALNRAVVIKVLPPDLAAGVNRERFRREIQLAAQLQHPHIVPLFFAGEYGDFLYYTMPYIDGESLKQAIGAKTHFSVREVIRTLRDVADALSYAHARGVAHRDIKPGNILRTQGHSLVTDFGVAKALSAALPGVGMTTSGMAIGTPAYMAPEQLAGDPAADSRVDIYAVGLLAYELLTGESPFFSTSPRETMTRQLTRDPESVSIRRPDVPLPLNALIMRCLAKDPDARPQAAAQLVAELDSLVTMSGDFSPQARASKRRGPMLAGIGAVVVIAGLTLLAWERGRDVAPPAAPIVVAAAPPLTHADSIAIAHAVDQKVAERNAAVARADSVRRAKADSASPKPSNSSKPAAPATPATVALDAAALAHASDSLRKEMMREVLDSVTKIQAALQGSRGRPGLSYVQIPNLDSLTRRASVLSPVAFQQRAANLGPPRRVFVSIPVGRPTNAPATEAATAMMDTLRAVLGRNPRYLVVARDSSAGALSKTRQTDSIAKLLDVELFASLQWSATADGHVTWQLTVRDLGAHSAYTNRLNSIRVAPDSLTSMNETLVTRAVTAMAELDHAPRKAAVVTR